MSVIVPTFDEEAELPALFDHLDSLDGEWEVLVADGGSHDRTLSIAPSGAPRSCPMACTGPAS